MNDAFDRLNEALAEPPLILHEQYPDGAPFVDWSPKVEEIREAVREVAHEVLYLRHLHMYGHLASGDMTQEEAEKVVDAEVDADIDRLFGKIPS